MTIQVGDKLPSVTLKRLGASGMEEVKTDEFFKGKKVALFAVPGAFTPTCSAKHLPGYIDNSEALRAKGIDQIVCLSVNDPFVMKAWGEHAGSGEKVAMLPDGNGEFTRALGLELNASANGLGQRSKRYAMVVDDGVVKSLAVDESGFGKSSAEEMLAAL